MTKRRFRLGSSPAKARPQAPGCLTTEGEFLGLHGEPFSETGFVLLRAMYWLLEMVLPKKPYAPSPAEAFAWRALREALFRDLGIWHAPSHAPVCHRVLSRLPEDLADIDPDVADMAWSVQIRPAQEAVFLRGWNHLADVGTAWCGERHRLCEYAVARYVQAMPGEVRDDYGADHCGRAAKRLGQTLPGYLETAGRECAACDRPPAWEPDRRAETWVSDASDAREWKAAMECMARVFEWRMQHPGGEDATSDLPRRCPVRRYGSRFFHRPEDLFGVLVAKARELDAAGKKVSQASIAERAGFSERSVRDWCKDLGLGEWPDVFRRIREELDRPSA